MSNIIEIRGMSKRFGDLQAVDVMDLSIKRGEIFGLLGPNAAGKSTTIRLLSGIISMDAGKVDVAGFDLRSQMDDVKASIGYVAQFFALYPELTVMENLDFYSAIYSHINKEKKQTLLKTYGLHDMADQRAGLLSGGYKRRLSIACALSHDPELIFLDEPTAGIDPVTRKELWDQFYALAAEGKTLFVTTHYMEEAERCNQLAFLHHGKIVAQGSPLSLISGFTQRKIYKCPIRHDVQLAKILAQTKGVQVLNQFGEELRIIADNALELDDLKAVLFDFYAKNIDVELVKPTIEDVFIALTQEQQS